MNTAGNNQQGRLQQGIHLPFTQAFQKILDGHGLVALEKPSTLLGHLLDEYGGEGLPPEVELLTRNCDRELLEPFVKAARLRDARELAQARDRTLLLLVERQNSTETSRLVSQGIYESISRHLRIAGESLFVPSNGTRRTDGTVQEVPGIQTVVLTQSDGFEQDEAGSNQHGTPSIVPQTPPRHKAFHASNGILISITILLSVAVGALSAYAIMLHFAPASGEPDNDSSSLVISDTSSDVATTSVVEYPTHDETPPANSAAQSSPSTTTMEVNGRGDGWLTSTTEFWGIWTLGSKNLDECIAYVNDVRALGYDAYVTHTSEWSNLNEDPWYVVTIGVYADETAARTALPGVRDGLDAEAYVKYSGQYEGATAD